MKEYTFRMWSNYCKSLIVFASLLFTSFELYAAVEPVPVRENKLFIGAGVNHNSVQYTAMDSRTEAVPLFELQFGPFFAYNHNDEPVFGVELFRHKRVMLALAGIYGSQQLDVSEASDDQRFVYYGIEDRQKATELALIFHFYSKVGLVDITVARDVSNTYDDFRSAISWSRPFADTGNWTITPRMYGRYYSNKYNNYYFGVSEEEMDRAILIAQSEGMTENSYRSLRPQFESQNAGQFGVDISIDYNFTESFMARGYIGMEQLAGQVTSSVLTEDADIWKVSLGIGYEF